MRWRKDSPTRKCYSRLVTIRQSSSDRRIIVSSNTIVADLFKAEPSVVGWFLARRMACVGCSLAAFDTISAVACSYNLDEAALLREIKSYLENSISENWKPV